MTQPPREDEGRQRPVMVTPLAALPTLQTLHPLGLDIGGTAGPACDLDDPDCVQPAGPVLPAGDEDRV